MHVYYSGTCIKTKITICYLILQWMLYYLFYIREAVTELKKKIGGGFFLVDG